MPGISEAGSRDLLANLAKLFIAKHEVLSPDYWIDFDAEPVACEYFSRPGKYLRPLFLLVSFLTVRSRVLGEKIHEGMDLAAILDMSTLFKVASALERFHQSCLALDDILDGADERRGGPALHIVLQDFYNRSAPQYLDPLYKDLIPDARYTVLQWGLVAMCDLWCAIAEATGSPPLDFSTGWGSRRHRLEGISVNNERDEIQNKERFRECIFEEISKWIGLYSNDLSGRLPGLQYDLLSSVLLAYRETLDGELRDLIWSNVGYDPTLPDLEWLHRLKTSRYSVLLPLEVGAKLADPKVSFWFLKCLEAAGLHFGTAFQKLDDLLVLAHPNQAGKDCRADLVNGSPTTVIILAAQRMRELRRGKEWNRLLQACQTSVTAQEKCIKLIREIGVADSVRRMVENDLAECDLALEMGNQRDYDTTLLRHMLHGMVGAMDDLSGVHHKEGV